MPGSNAGSRFRRALAGAVAGALAAVIAAGCGASYKLPTETARGRVVPTDKSYQMIATWTGMDGINDLLLTQGSGTQLFLLFNHGGTGTAPRGEVVAYPLTRPEPIRTIQFHELFNPIALCAAANKIYVLDAGDTCLARTNPNTGTCAVGPPGDPWNCRITDLSVYWRVKVFGLLGGDTLETFTDTTMAAVQGVAADVDGNVYISGSAIILVPDPQDARVVTRALQYRIYKFSRGPRYPGIFPADRHIPGSNWHRDTTWVVDEGSGIGTVVDPRGLYWSNAGGRALFAADFNKSWIQKLSDSQASTGFFQIDGSGSGAPLNGPIDVTADLQGFIYLVDSGNRRVLRYDAGSSYVQRVDVEPDAQGQQLVLPVAVAADDSVAYVADAGSKKVIRYRRRD